MSSGFGGPVLAWKGPGPLLVEIQALVSRTHFGTPRRLATGVDPQRLALVCRGSGEASGRESVGSGHLSECCRRSCRWKSLPPIWRLSAPFFRACSIVPMAPSTLIFGEVGLGGEVRPAMFPEVRLKEASLLGFKRARHSRTDPFAGIAHCHSRSFRYVI